MSDGAGKDCALPDTLRVGTLYSPTSFFIYRGDSLGYDYDLVNRFAADKGMKVKLTVAGSLPRLIEMANEGDIDHIRVCHRKRNGTGSYHLNQVLGDDGVTVDRPDDYSSSKLVIEILQYIPALCAVYRVGLEDARGPGLYREPL